MKTFFLASFFFLICLSAHAFYLDASAAPNTVTLTANLSSLSNTIPADFVGLSAEMQDISADTIYTGSNTSLISLLGLLGPNGTFRYGGTTCDSATPLSFTSTIASDVSNFVKGLGAGWKIIACLDLGANDVSTAVAWATNILTAFGSSSIVFQMGNEPDQTYTPSGYGAAWNNYYSTLISDFPSMLFDGSDCTAPSGCTSYVSQTTIGIGGAHAITGHYYCGTANAEYWKVSNLLACSQGFTSGNGITESGGISGGGYDSVTNVLAMASFYLLTVMNEAATGIIFHAEHQVLTPYAPWGNRIAYYNAVAVQGDGGYSPTPLFYGLYLFSKIEGQQIAATSNSNTSLIAAISTQRANGKANILATNLTPSSVSIKPDQSSNWTSANLLILGGTSCLDKNPTLGGAAIGESGVWSGSFQKIFKGQNFVIPPCGAALLEIQ